MEAFASDNTSGLLCRGPSAGGVNAMRLLETSKIGL